MTLFSMQNPWKVNSSASAFNPPSFSIGEPVPDPPDPPDPASPLFPVQFPHLSSTTKIVSKTSSSLKKALKTHVIPTTAPAETSFSSSVLAHGILDLKVSKVAQIVLDSAPTSKSETQTATDQNSETFKTFSQNYTIILPKSSSPPPPPITNRASSASNTSPLASNTIPPATKNLDPRIPLLPNPTGDTLVVEPIPSITANNLPHGPSLVKIIASEDKTLSRLAPVSISPSGRQIIFIPDEVFQKAAELHKGFIICYYNGKAPPFHQIQSVLNHMWGKGKKLEIHNKPLNRSTIFCIPNNYMRQKILEKSIWYVGDSMFHTA